MVYRSRGIFPSFKNCISLACLMSHGVSYKWPNEWLEGLNFFLAITQSLGMKVWVVLFFRFFVVISHPFGEFISISFLGHLGMVYTRCL